MLFCLGWLASEQDNVHADARWLASWDVWKAFVLKRERYLVLAFRPPGCMVVGFFDSSGEEVGIRYTNFYSVVVFGVLVYTSNSTQLVSGVPPLTLPLPPPSPQSLIDFLHYPTSLPSISNTNTNQTTTSQDDVRIPRHRDNFGVHDRRDVLSVDTGNGGALVGTEDASAGWGAASG